MVKVAVYSVELNNVKVALIDPNGETYYAYRNKPSLVNKEILEVINGNFEIVLNENKTGKSFFYVKNSKWLKPGNFIKVTNLDEIYDFIIISVEKTKESNIVKIVCEDLVNIFNRKIPYDYKIFIDSYKDYLSRHETDPLLPMQPFIDDYFNTEIKTIENYIGFMILMNFVSDDLYSTMKKEYLFTWLYGKVPRQQYWDLARTTATENKVKTYKENGLINLKTYIVNAWKQYNIDLNMKISGFTPMLFDKNKAFEDLTLEGTIIYFPKRKEKKKPQNIDSSTTEIIKAEITNKDKLTSTVILYKEDDEANPYTMLLLKKKNSDEYITVDSNEEYIGKTIGENAEYELADGEVIVDVISENLEDKTEEEKQKALRKQAADIMRGNRYNHLIEFCIPKNSQLVDVKNLNVLDPVNIKIDGKIYESYISEKIIKDQNLVYYKSGQLKATLTEKLTEEKEESIEKVNQIVNVKIQNLNNKIEKIKDTNIFPNIEGMKIPTKKILWKNNSGSQIVTGNKSDITLYGMPNLSQYISEDSDYVLHLYLQYMNDGIQVFTIGLNTPGPHWVSYIRDLGGYRNDILFLALAFKNLNTTNWVCQLGGNISVDRNRNVENNTVYDGYKLKKVVLEKL